VKSDNERSKILRDYYENYYHKVLCSTGPQSRGIAWLDLKLESFWNSSTYEPKRLLELGFASGEHLSKIYKYPTEQYIGFDIATPTSNTYINSMPKEISGKFKFVQGDVHDLPFPDHYFDRIVSTCLLHHLIDPLLAMREIRRVSTPGGEISFAIPTDPGLLNQLIKRLITYPKMRKLGVKNPVLIYALEHRNHVSGILALLRHVFKEDQVDLKFLPFHIKSWNLNFVIIAHITRRSIDAN